MAIGHKKSESTRLGSYPVDESNVCGVSRDEFVKSVEKVGLKGVRDFFHDKFPLFVPEGKCIRFLVPEVKEYVDAFAVTDIECLRNIQVELYRGRSPECDISRIADLYDSLSDSAKARLSNDPALFPWKKGLCCDDYLSLSARRRMIAEKEGWDMLYDVRFGTCEADLREAAFNFFCSSLSEEFTPSFESLRLPNSIKLDDYFDIFYGEKQRYLKKLQDGLSPYSSKVSRQIDAGIHVTPIKGLSPAKEIEKRCNRDEVDFTLCVVFPHSREEKESVMNKVAEISGAAGDSLIIANGHSAEEAASDFISRLPSEYVGYEKYRTFHYKDGLPHPEDGMCNLSRLNAVPEVKSVMERGENFGLNLVCVAGDYSANYFSLDDWKVFFDKLDKVGCRLDSLTLDGAFGENPLIKFLLSPESRAGFCLNVDILPGRKEVKDLSREFCFMSDEEIDNYIDSFVAHNHRVKKSFSAVKKPETGLKHPASLPQGTVYTVFPEDVEKGIVPPGIDIGVSPDGKKFLKFSSQNRMVPEDGLVLVKKHDLSNTYNVCTKKQFDLMYMVGEDGLAMKAVRQEQNLKPGLRKKSSLKM